jgi:hypothetical protein
VVVSGNIFYVPIELAIKAIGNLSFVPWRFKFNFALLKEFNIEYILVRSMFEFDKRPGER